MSIAPWNTNNSIRGLRNYPPRRESPNRKQNFRWETFVKEDATEHELETTASNLFDKRANVSYDMNVNVD